MPEEKTICPFCQSNLTVRLGCETHCNSCGKSFALDKNPISTQAADRRAAATGFPAHHESEGLGAVEQKINQAEREFSEAVLNVARHAGNSEERLQLRQAERDAKQRLDKLLQERGELATQRTRPWPQR
jgi:hypothetical protein